MRNCARRLVLICSLKITVFRERSSSKTMSFKELLIFQDKYISVISRQMEATVLIILCNIFAARRTKCSRKVYLSMTGMITFQCSLVRLHKQTNMSLLCKNTKTLSYLEFTLNADFRDSLREYFLSSLCFRWGVLKLRDVLRPNALE